MKYSSLILIVMAAAGTALHAADVMIDKCDNIKNWKVSRVVCRTIKGPALKYNSAEKALHIESPSIVSRTFSITRRLTQKPEIPGLDFNKQYTGIAFKVKGDGSNEWGAITICGGPMERSIYFFPMKNKQWKEYRVPFAAMAPCTDHNMTFSTMAGMKLAQINLGDRWSIREGNTVRKQFSYMIKDIRLVDDKFAAPKKYKGAKLANAIAKMKSGKPVLILCIGDSITAGTGLRNRARDRYGMKLQDILRKHFKNDKIRVRVPAVGGAHTSDSIAWLERDLAGETPDVVTMLIGYNNRSGRQSAEMYTKQLELWIDRLLTATAGKTAVVLIPSVPGVPRFHDQRDMADATRAIAKKRGFAVADIEKWILSLEPMTYRKKYLVDGVHPSVAGHVKYAEILSKVFTGKK